jgi:hypothetical protein
MQAALSLGRRLPPDGRGWFTRESPEFADATRAARDAFWDGRLPHWARWAAVGASGCAWGLFAPLLALHYARVRHLPLGDSWRLAWNCLLCGGQPNEVWIWSHCFPERGLHPLPATSANVLFSWLGDAECLKVLSDKVAAAQMLEASGLRTPKIVRVIARGSLPVIGADFFGSRYSGLFVKPRHGSAGRGTLSLDVCGEGRFSVNGGDSVGAEDLAARLAAGAAADDLLVEERLEACPELADLSAGGAPVLRVTTAREPGGPPFLHSVLLTIPVPGENPVDFLKGHVWAAVNPDSGVLGYGIRLEEPGNRIDALNWNSAPLSGRVLPWFAQCIEAALAAMRLVPGLPLAAWDAILTSVGPSILEGNSSGSWILTSLPSLQAMEAASLEPVLMRWARQRRPLHYQ